MNWGRLNFFTSKQQLLMHLEGYAQSKIISFHWADFDYKKGRFRTVKQKEVQRNEKISNNFVRV